MLQRRLGELERQLLRKVAELEDEKSLLHNETSAHRQKTESTLNALLQRVTELERGTCCVPDALSESGLLFPTRGRPRISIYGQQGSSDTEVQQGDGSQVFVEISPDPYQHYPGKTKELRTSLAQQPDR